MIVSPVIRSRRNTSQLPLVSHAACPEISAVEAEVKAAKRPPPAIVTSVAPAGAPLEATEISSAAGVCGTAPVAGGAALSAQMTASGLATTWSRRRERIASHSPRLRGRAPEPMGWGSPSLAPLWDTGGVGFGPYELTVRELVAVRAAERVGGPFVLLRDAEAALVLQPLEGEQLRIGRAPDNHLILDWDGEVSRAHARLERVGGRWAVVDDGLSRNGTYVGTERVHGRRVLSNGDVVRIGQTSLVARGIVDALGETITSADTASAIALSPAELRVLAALCAPCVRDPAGPIAPASNPEIAEELVLSVAGVKTHMRALFAKFDVEELPQNRKRAELARRAMALGLVR
jgi:hypothetical protein